MSVALLGYRGSGKSTIGARLADRLWLPFVDLDAAISQSAKRTIREIFADGGEAGFRELEHDELASVLARTDEFVLSLGGGAILREDNRLLLMNKNLKRVYLKCDPAVLLAHIAADPQTAATRPALTELGGGMEEIAALLAVREPLYRAVMTAELDVSRLTIDEAVARLSRLI